jgi:hypothetical protein
MPAIARMGSMHEGFGWIKNDCASGIKGLNDGFGRFGGLCSIETKTGN